jgi:CheY-like chemotaxis protein
MLSKILLVEDNQADADLVSEMLNEVGEVHYEVDHVLTLREALDRLKQKDTNLTLLDLSLPDSSGLQSLKAIHSAAPDMPIVVFTSTEDEKLAESCIECGAHDYIRKSGLRPIVLRRSIGFALEGAREAQIGALERNLERYRGMSSSAPGFTSVTRSLAGSASLREREPQLFASLVTRYRALLDEYFDCLILKRERPRRVMETLVTVIGDHCCGPRDLIDIHVAALDLAFHELKQPQLRAYAVEGRLIALEMMGYLVDYYRIGVRRMGSEGSDQ